MLAPPPKREREVIGIMLTLFDQEVAERLRVASAVREARAEVMNAMKIPPDQQAIYTWLR